MMAKQLCSCRISSNDIPVDAVVEDHIVNIMPVDSVGLSPHTC